MSSPSTIVLITGANSGVGYATSQVLASASPNYHVIIGSRSLSNGSAAVSSIQASGIKGSLSAIQLDVTDEASISAAAQHVQDQFGRLDVLINNAGIFSQDASLKKQFEDTFSANVIGPALVTAAFEPLLRKSQRPYLLYVSSALGSLGLASDPSHGTYAVGLPAYRASKAALDMLAIEDAKRLGREGVKVFAICPGLVRSNLRGKAEEAVSAGGNAGDPVGSGRLMLSVIEGERNGDVGRLVHQNGVYPW